MKVDSKAKLFFPNSNHIKKNMYICINLRNVIIKATFNLKNVIKKR